MTECKGCVGYVYSFDCPAHGPILKKVFMCEDETMMRVHIQREWDREKIINFALHLMGDKCQGCQQADKLFGFGEWWKKRGYESDFPSDRYLAEEAWKAARGLQYYPCAKCGTWRTESEGGTTFTVCDECRDKKS